MRYYVHGINCLQVGWVRFDLLLVIIGIFSMLVVGNVDTDTEALGTLMVLRILRIIRLARIFRLMVQFKELWMLSRGLLQSAFTMAHVFLLLVVMLYLFACLALEVITKSSLREVDPEFDRYA